MDVFIQLAIAASQFAMDDAGLTVTRGDRRRASASSSRSGIGGFSTIEREHKALLEGGPRRISPFFIPAAIINLAAGQVSIRFGAKGPNSATCTACSASAHAIGDAFEIIRRDDADVMIAGGSEAAITPMGVGGFAAMRALSTRNDEPARASRPFDKDRDGFVMGEGAGVIILEELEFATRRGAHDLRRAGRLRHVGRRVPHHRALRGRRRRHARHADGADARRRRARSRSTTSTRTAPRRRINDKLETLAIKRLFGEHAAQAGDLVDQVDDRPPARRGRRARSRHHRARDQAPAHSADHQLRDARPRVRSRLRAEHQRARDRSTTRCRTRSASAAPTGRCCSRGLNAIAASSSGSVQRAQAKLTSRAFSEP